MRKSMMLLLVMVMAVMFSGCAGTGTKTTVVKKKDMTGNVVTTTTTEPGPLLGMNDYDTHGNMYKDFKQGQTDQITAVVAAPLTASTPEAKGYEAGMKYMAVQSISSQRFDQAKPTTLWDDVKALIGVSPELAVIHAAENMTTSAIDKAGGVVTNTGNGTITLDHSMDTTKSQSTNIGAGSSSASTGVDDNTNKQNPIDNSVSGEAASAAKEGTATE